MKQLYRIYDLYADGFRNMKIGRTLWTIIIIKLIIIFAVLKVFFFPDFLAEHAPNGDKAEFVAGEILGDWRLKLKIEDWRLKIENWRLKIENWKFK